MVLFKMLLEIGPVSKGGFAKVASAFAGMASLNLLRWSTEKITGARILRKVTVHLGRWLRDGWETQFRIVTNAKRRESRGGMEGESDQCIERERNEVRLFGGKF
jgi:hypothetical protein